MQWISGTQYVSPIDLDLLIGGPDRPPSKRMMALAAEEDRLARSGGPSRAGTAPAQEGWGDYMTRQLNERTERLNIIGDSTDQMLDHSQGWEGLVLLFSVLDGWDYSSLHPGFWTAVLVIYAISKI
jgi:syntaxin-binding protein 5